MPNYYSKVMEILYETPITYDYRAIVHEIARKHPKMVIDAFRAKDNIPWKQEVADIIRGQGNSWKVSAIKLWRANTGCSLKEAKDAVEDYHERL